MKGNLVNGGLENNGQGGQFRQRDVRQRIQCNRRRSIINIRFGGIVTKRWGSL